MTKEKELAEDLGRLTAATVLFATQEYERMLMGGTDEYENVTCETHDVVSGVLEQIEESMDEDLLERLDRDRLPRAYADWVYGPALSYYRALRPLSHWVNAGPGNRRMQMLDQILEDFRLDVEDRLKRSRRQKRAMSEDEINELLEDLKEDLKVVARKSERRERLREDSDEPDKRDERKSRRTRRREERDESAA